MAGVAITLLGWENPRSPWQSRSDQQKAVVVETQTTRDARPLWQRHILRRYVARQYLAMLALSLALLLTGYLLVDVLERLQWFARYQEDSWKVFQFYNARLPLLASRVVPMSLLLATALTVALLSSRRELTGMHFNVRRFGGARAVAGIDDCRVGDASVFPIE